MLNFPISLRKLLDIGAEEGTRTPTPLRVHGPEPCASANSATSALVDQGAASMLHSPESKGTALFIQTEPCGSVKRPAGRHADGVKPRKLRQIIGPALAQTPPCNFSHSWATKLPDSA